MLTNDAGFQFEHILTVLQKYFSALHNCDAAVFNAMFHPQGLLLGVGPNHEIVVRDASQFCAGVEARGGSAQLASHDKIISLEMVGSTCATAEVQIALPPAPDSPTPTTDDTLYTDFLTLLKDPVLGWRIISKTYSSRALGAPPSVAHRTEPADVAAVSAALWGGYVAAGRVCDVEGMKRVFHPACRLTFATDQSLVIVSSAEFCDEYVGRRWQRMPHAPYAHLKDDERISGGDTLVSVSFAGPRVARAILKVGYPPFLYTDVLLLLKLDDEWWIVAKSSANQPFFEDESRPVAAGSAAAH